MPHLPARPTAHHPACTPFSSAADAWFWTASALNARQDGARSRDYGPRIPRPCEPDDVIRCLERLYAERRIGPAHAAVLRDSAERRSAPDPARSRPGDCLLWREVLDRLGPPLRAKGIIA